MMPVMGMAAIMGAADTTKEACKPAGPKISVGMPVYNGGEWLSEAIDSILGQTFHDFELIIADNASTDNTADICRHYSERDPRIRYYRSARNIGASENYNVVFRYARGRYFKWASANDYCDKTLLMKCADVLDSRPDVVLCYAKTKLIHEPGGEAEDYHDGLDLQDEDACQRFRRFMQNIRLNNAMNGLIRTEVLAGTDLMKKHLSEDINLMAELTLHGKFVEIPEYLFFRRISETCATSMQSQLDVLDHYDPQNESLMVFQQWQIYLDYFLAVWRSPLNAGEKLALYRFLARRGIINRHDLASDFFHSLRRVMGFILSGEIQHRP